MLFDLTQQRYLQEVWASAADARQRLADDESPRDNFSSARAIALSQTRHVIRDRHSRPSTPPLTLEPAPSITPVTPPIAEPTGKREQLIVIAFRKNLQQGNRWEVCIAAENGGNPTFPDGQCRLEQAHAEGGTIKHGRHIWSTATGIDASRLHFHNEAFVNLSGIRIIASVVAEFPVMPKGAPPNDKQPDDDQTCLRAVQPNRNAQWTSLMSLCSNNSHLDT